MTEKENGICKKLKASAFFIKPTRTTLMQNDFL